MRGPLERAHENRYMKFNQGKVIREKWSTKDELLEYYNQAMKRADERFGPTSRVDLKEMIAKMNYNSKTDRRELVSAMERAVVPWFPVDERNGNVYRILTSAYGLHPD
jgi:hypothetical protein